MTSQAASYLQYKDMHVLFLFLNKLTNIYCDKEQMIQSAVARSCKNTQIVHLYSLIKQFQHSLLIYI